MTERCGGCSQDTWRKVCWWSQCEIKAYEPEDAETTICPQDDRPCPFGCGAEEAKGCKTWFDMIAAEAFKAKLRSINFGRVPGGARK